MHDGVYPFAHCERLGHINNIDAQMSRLKKA
jgi:hypothetical protein